MRTCNCTLYLSNPDACNRCSNSCSAVPQYEPNKNYIAPGNPGEVRRNTHFPAFSDASTGELVKGWICPKCGRVYATWVYECKSCNDKIRDKENKNV